MTTVAFIPARGGSERIPRKNLALVGGVTLVGRAGSAAWLGGCDRVVVSTDDADIAATAVSLLDGPQVEVHDRPAELAGPHAQIEDAVAHWLAGELLEGLADDDVIVLLQPTSPFRTPETVRRCIEAARVHGSALTVHHDTGAYFGGTLDLGGPECVGIEWRRSMAHRPRSQDLRAEVREDGCCYAFTVAHFRKTRCRMGDLSAPILIDRWEALDVDTPEDLAVAQAIAAAGLR